MKKLPLIIFCFIMLSALISSTYGYCDAKRQLDDDANLALAITLKERPGDVVDADTLQCYRNHLTYDELKDTACLSVRTTRRNGKTETEITADANCTFLTILKLSNQKASSTLLCMAVLWIMVSYGWRRRHKHEPISQGIEYGGLIYHDHLFSTSSGGVMRLTPMQHALLEMLITAETHTLSKNEICERLWPKKPCANDTLYTLVRRTKPIIEANSQLQITSDRGKSYTLEIKA